MHIFLLQQLDVTLLHRAFQLAEGDSRRVDDGRFGAQVVDEADPALTGKDFDVFPGGDVQMFHEFVPYFRLLCSSR